MVRRMLLADNLEQAREIARMTYIGRVEPCSAEESPFVEHIFVHAWIPLFTIRFALDHLQIRTPFPLNSYTGIIAGRFLFSPLPPKLSLQKRTSQVSS